MARFDRARMQPMVPRQVEIYNGGDQPVATEELAARIRLYSPDAQVAKLAGRVLIPGRATEILAAGVDFADLTDIFTPEACRILLDEVTAAPEQGGVYGRIFMVRAAARLVAGSGRAAQPGSAAASRRANVTRRRTGSRTGQDMRRGIGASGGAGQLCVQRGHGGNDHVIHHLIHQIGNVELGCAGLDGLLLQPIQLVILADVAGYSDNLGIVVVLFQPGNNNRSVQAAGVGQYNLFDVLLVHIR